MVTETEGDITWTLPTFKVLVDERFAALEREHDKDAIELARRLESLNHMHERESQLTSTYVTQEKYEDNLASELTAREAKLESERIAREAALLRVNERFEEYVRRYEVRQREVDLLLAAQKGAAESAARAAEDQGRKSNRNLAIAGLLLSLLIAVSNYLSRDQSLTPAQTPAVITQTTTTGP